MMDRLCSKAALPTFSVEPRRRTLLRLDRNAVDRRAAPVELSLTTAGAGCETILVPVTETCVIALEHFTNGALFVRTMAEDVELTPLDAPEFLARRAAVSRNFSENHKLYASMLFDTLYNRLLTGTRCWPALSSRAKLERFQKVASALKQTSHARLFDVAAHEVQVLVECGANADWSFVERLIDILPQSADVVVVGAEAPPSSMAGSALRWIGTRGDCGVLPLCEALYACAYPSPFLIRIRLVRTSGDDIDAATAWIENRATFNSLTQNFDAVLGLLRRNQTIGMVFDRPVDPIEQESVVLPADLLARLGLPGTSPLNAPSTSKIAWLRTESLSRLHNLNFSMSNAADQKDRSDALLVDALLPEIVYFSGRRVIATSEIVPESINRNIGETRWAVRRAAPFARSKVALFVTVAAHGAITGAASHYMMRLKENGFDVIALCVVQSIDDALRDPGPAICDALYLRENEGYDFAFWADALRRLEISDRYEEALLANDSVLGPLDDLAPLFRRCAESRADVIGLTESLDFKRHFQSYFLYFKRTALRSDAFRDFWRNVKNIGDKSHVIRAYEVELLAKLEASGLTAECLFPLTPIADAVTLNPSVHRWRELIAQGFPFVKAQVLRDNPAGDDLSGWDEIFSASGWDLEIVEEALCCRRPDPAIHRFPRNGLERKEHGKTVSPAENPLRVSNAVH